MNIDEKCVDLVASRAGVDIADFVCYNPQAKVTSPRGIYKTFIGHL